MTAREIFWPLSVLTLLAVQISKGGVRSEGEFHLALSVVDAVVVSALIGTVAGLLTTPIALIPLYGKRYGARWWLLFPVVLFVVSLGVFALLAVAPTLGGPVR